MPEIDKSNEQKVVELHQRIDQLEKSRDEWRQTAKTLNEKEKRYRGMIENLVEGIWHINSDGYTAYLNRTMCSLLEIKGPDERAGIT